MYECERSGQLKVNLTGGRFTNNETEREPACHRFYGGGGGYSGRLVMSKYPVLQRIRIQNDVPFSEKRLILNTPLLTFSKFN